MAKYTFLFSAALSGLLTASFTMPAHANAAASGDKMEKCYGIVKAGKNSCANANGVHSCAGQSKVDNDPGDWVNLAASECARDGGTATPSKPASPPAPATKS